MAEEVIYTPEEVGKKLKITSRKVIEIIERGEMRAINVNSEGKYSKWRIPESSLNEFLSKSIQKK
ncbi:MAG: helix-turn-helix domain-containing protein [Desulfobacterales bacterium]|nr:helix-turn-helix domain-containing protein [Desulfobacterales bacterium]